LVASSLIKLSLKMFKLSKKYNEIFVKENKKYIGIFKKIQKNYMEPSHLINYSETCVEVAIVL